MYEKIKKQRRERFCVFIICIGYLLCYAGKAITGEHIGVFGIIGCIVMAVDGIYCLVSYLELRKIKNNEE